jgi:hypothetical protein
VSVFSNFWNKQVKKNEVVAQSHPIENTVIKKEEIPCRRGHLWNGREPKVDPQLLQIQNNELINVLCDCKRIRYNEGMCTCPANPYWEIKLEEVN